MVSRQAFEWYFFKWRGFAYQCCLSSTWRHPNHKKHGVWVDFLSLEDHVSHFLLVTSHSFAPVLMYSRSSHLAVGLPTIPCIIHRCWISSPVRSVRGVKSTCLSQRGSHSRSTLSHSCFNISCLHALRSLCTSKFFWTQVGGGGVGGGVYIHSHLAQGLFLYLFKHAGLNYLTSRGPCTTRG